MAKLAGKGDKSRRHAEAARRAKLGPLFTVCLFPSYRVLMDGGEQGQLVIRKSWMPGIAARSVCGRLSKRRFSCEYKL